MMNQVDELNWPSVRYCMRLKNGTDWFGQTMLDFAMTISGELASGQRLRATKAI
jgi:hypothetical protein